MESLGTILGHLRSNISSVLQRNSVDPRSIMSSDVMNGDVPGTNDMDLLASVDGEAVWTPITSAMLVPCAKIYLNTSPTSHTSTGNYQAVPLDTASFDNYYGGSAQVDLANNRLTCSTPGIYVITAQVRFSSNATGGRAAQIRVNGTLAAQQGVFTTSVSAIAAVNLSVIVSLASGDNITLEAYQNSGGNLAYSIGWGSTWLAFHMVSAA